MLRQIVGDLKPGSLARHEEVTFRAYTRVIVETAKSNSEFRGAIRAVDNWRTADAAKSAMKSRRGFKVFDKFLPLNPPEILHANARTAAKGGAVRLSAVRAMTMAAAHERPRYFVFDTAAQTASSNYRHANVSSSAGHRILQGFVDILGFQVGIFGDDLIFGRSDGE